MSIYNLSTHPTVFVCLLICLWVYSPSIWSLFAVSLEKLDYPLINTQFQLTSSTLPKRGYMSFSCYYGWRLFMHLVPLITLRRKNRMKPIFLYQVLHPLTPKKIQHGKIMALGHRILTWNRHISKVTSLIQ